MFKIYHKILTLTTSTKNFTSKGEGWGQAQEPPPLKYAPTLNHSSSFFCRLAAVRTYGLLQTLRLSSCCLTGSSVLMISLCDEAKLWGRRQYIASSNRPAGISSWLSQTEIRTASAGIKSRNLSDLVSYLVWTHSIQPIIPWGRPRA